LGFDGWRGGVLRIARALIGDSSDSAVRIIIDIERSIGSEANPVGRNFALPGSLIAPAKPSANTMLHSIPSVTTHGVSLARAAGCRGITMSAPTRF
jgi:hypothetical protein